MATVPKKQYHHPPPALVTNAVSQSRRRLRKRKVFERHVPEALASLTYQSDLVRKLRECDRRVERSLISLQRCLIDPIITSPRVVTRTCRIHFIAAPKNDGTFIVRLHGRLRGQPGAPPLIEAVYRPSDGKTSLVSLDFGRFFYRIVIQIRGPGLIAPLSFEAERTTVGPADGLACVIPKVQLPEWILTSGTAEVTAHLYRTTSPPSFQCDDPLQNLLGIDTAPLSQIVSALWEYVKGNRLQSKDDRTVVVCDEAMAAVFNCPTFPLGASVTFLRPHLRAPPPVVLTCPISLERNERAYDVQLGICDPLHSHLSAFQPSAMSPELEDTQNKIFVLVDQINEMYVRKSFFSGCAEDPVDFLYRFLGSQDADLSMMHAEGPPNPEFLRYSAHYTHPWMPLGVKGYLSKRKRAQELSQAKREESAAAAANPNVVVKASTALPNK